MKTPWLRSWGPDPSTRPVLVCLPQAGAGCGQFSPWQRQLGDGVAVVGVQLPGREDRWSDPPCPSVTATVEAIATDLLAVTAPEQPLVVFGHSFGGLLAFEVTHRLARTRGRWPDALVVSACRAPRRWVGAGRGLADDDAELDALLSVRALDPDDIDEDTYALFRELLRRDAQLSLSYDNADAAPVGCPLEVWGADDDATVPLADLDEWGAYAGGEFRLRRFPGGHYFVTEQPERVLPIFHERLRPRAEAPAARPEPLQPAQRA